MWESLQSNVRLDHIVIFILVVVTFLAVFLFIGVKWQKWSLRDSVALLITGFLLTIAFVALAGWFESTGVDRRTRVWIGIPILTGFSVFFAWLGNRFVRKRR